MPGWEANPSGRSRTGCDYDRENPALVEHFLRWPMEPETCHQVFLRIVFDDLALDRRIAADFRLADKRGPALPAYPDDHEAAAADALCLPGRGLRLDKHQMIRRDREPDRRRRALITVLADRGDIEHAGGGKRVEVALRDLSVRWFAVRRPTARRRSSSQCWVLSPDRRVRAAPHAITCRRVSAWVMGFRRVAAVANGCSIHRLFLKIGPGEGFLISFKTRIVHRDASGSFHLFDIGRLALA